MSKLVGNGLGYITLGTGKCNRCAHVKARGQSCLAYPKGIPQAILTGQHDHRKPYRGDGGVRFEKRQ